MSSFIILRNFDGSRNQHAVPPLPQETTNEDAAKYCLDNNFPGWVRRTGYSEGVKVYVLKRGIGPTVVTDYNSGLYQNGQYADYDTYLMITLPS